MMASWKRAGCFLSEAVKALFGALMCCILFATVVLDKTVKFPCPNTALFANGAYYLFAFILLCVMLRVIFIRPGRPRPSGISRSDRSKTRTYYYSLALTAVVVALMQYVVSRWFPYRNISKGEFKHILDASWDLANGGSLEKYSYFRTSPNNVNLTIVLSWVYSILHNQRAVVWLGALITNASVVLTSLAVYNVTKRESVALLVAGVGEVLVALTWRAFVVYTDNYGMIIAALVLWLYTCDIKPEIKIPAILFCVACGSCIKITNILFVAILGINGLINWLRTDSHRINIRRLFIYTGCLVILFGTLFTIQEPVRRYYGYRPGSNPKGWQYLFLVGQNTEMLGVVGGNNNHIREKYIEEYQSSKAVNRALFNKALERIRKRKFWGNIAFYEKKLTVAYNDGYFRNVQNKKLLADLERNALYDVYILDGKLYQASATVFQTLWDAVLLTMMLYVASKALLRRLDSRRKKAFSDAEGKSAPTRNDVGRIENRIERETVQFLMLGILAITAYLLCLEGRAKYLYMFLPVYLGAFGVMFHRIGIVVAMAVKSVRVDG